MANERPVAKGDPKRDANRDPITGAPGSHPVGTGVGAAAGAVGAGAAVGSCGRTVGTAVGAAVGAVVGGLAGKGIAERIDPTVEDQYWRENYKTRPYVAAGSSYDDYGPAYRYGWDSYGLYGDRSFDVAEPELRASGTEARQVAAGMVGRQACCSRFVDARARHDRARDAGRFRS